MFDVIPLGVASALPTLNRHFSSTALVREGRVFLFDCGEGTQRRLGRAALKRPRIEAIFITHFHGDHLFGLPGLLSTLGLLDYQGTLHVVGPAGLRDALAAFQTPSGGRGLPFEVIFVELPADFSEMVVLDTPECRVVARRLVHTVFVAGYRFEEKPRPGNLDVDKARALGVTDVADYRRLKAGEAVRLPDGGVLSPGDVVGPSHPGASFAYVTDTRPCEGGRLLAQRADLLYHEATFRDRDRDRSIETGHSTATDAAIVAREAGARRLLLGHFSARYDEANIEALVREAKAVFQNTEAAEELKRYFVTPEP